MGGPPGVTVAAGHMGVGPKAPLPGSVLEPVAHGDQRRQSRLMAPLTAERAGGRMGPSAASQHALVRSAITGEEIAPRR
jgi:hypothetical protein